MVHCYLGKGCRTCMRKHTSFFFLKIVTIKKPKTGCIQKTMCVCIFKYITCVCIRKGLEGTLPQKQQAWVTVRRGTWRESKKRGTWAL